MFNPEITQLIRRDFELATSDANAENISETDLFQLLSNEVANMIATRLDFLLSLMYRLDIDEAKIAQALSPHQPLPANMALAHLILERQKQRVFTKKNVKVLPLQDDDVERW